MREPKITTYQTEHGEQLVSALYQLFQYTSDDAQYRDFDVAYEHFIAGEAAMIPNGYWMLEQMEESFAQNVGFSPFPENMIIASPEMSGWCVVDTYEEDVKAGAVEFLKFRTLYYARQKEEMHEAHSDLPPAADYAATLSAPFTLVPNYQVKWNSIFQEETLNTYLPGFVSNEITAAEFLGYMDESIARYQQEVSDE